MSKNTRVMKDRIVAQKIADDILEGVKKHDLKLFRHGLSAYQMLVKMEDPFIRSFDTVIQEAIGRSVDTGYVDGIKALLEYGIPVDFKLPTGNALTKAAYYGQTEVVKVLLKNKADPNFQFSGGWTALMNACNAATHTEKKEEFHKIVALLLEQKASVESREQEAQQTALVHALVGKDLTLVRLLLNTGTNINMAISDTGKTALHFAVEHYSEEVFNYLVERKGLEIDCLNKKGGTPLLYVSPLVKESKITKKQARDIVVNLLKKGAKLQLHDLIRELLPKSMDLVISILESAEFKQVIQSNMSIGTELLQFSALHGYHRMAEILISIDVPIECHDPKGNTPLHMAAQEGHTSIIELLIKQGADKHAKSKFVGNTALNKAAAYGHLNCVQALVRAGADVNLTDNNGRTALHWAFATLTTGTSISDEPKPKNEETAEAIIHCLLEAKADLNILIERYSPLMAAIYYQYKTCIKLLVEKSTTDDLNRMVDGRSALGLAARLGDAKTVELLISRSADVNQFDRTIPLANSPLSYAAKSGHKDCFELLLAAKADINLDSACPALIAAAENNRIDIVRFLLQLNETSKGAVDLEIRDLHGDSALIRAAREGHTQIVELLLKAGADPDGTNHRGTTALMSAAYHGKCETMESLIKGGASLELEINGFRNAALSASSGKQIGSLKILHQYGYSFDKPNSFGETALWYNLTQNNSELVRFLLETVKIDTKEIWPFAPPALQSFFENKTLIHFAGGVETYRYLYGKGFRGKPLLMQLVLVSSAINGDIKHLEESLQVVDVNDVIDHEFVAFGTHPTINPLFNSNPTYVEISKQNPIFAAANGTSSEIFAAFLKNKLCSNYKNKFKPNTINLFVSKLMASGQNFAFTREGTLCFQLNRKGQLYPATLAKRGEEALLKSSAFNLSDVLFQEALFQHIEENLEIKEEQELRDLQKEVLETLRKGFDNFSPNLEKLADFKKVLALGFLRDQTQAITELENHCLVAQNKFNTLLNSVENFDVSKDKEHKTRLAELTEYQKETKNLIQTIMKEIMPKVLNIQKEVNQLFKEQQVQTIKELLKKHKQSITRAVSQRNEALNTALQMTTDWLNEIASLESKEITEGDTPSKPKIIQKTKTQIQALQKQAQSQTTRIVPKGKAAEAPDISSFNPLLEQVKKMEAHQENAKYLSIPDRNFGSTTSIAPRIQIKEAFIPLKAIVDTLNQDATGLDQRIHYLAALGALAQVLETRIELSENWPNNIRNIIFHFEEAIQNLGDEPHCINSIKTIFNKLHAFPETSLAKTEGRIKLEQVDYQGFLAGLNGKEIPKPTIENSLDIIKAAEQQLNTVKEYLIKNIKEIQEGIRLNVIKMAVGFALTRIGTALNDVKKLDPKHPALETRLGKYIPLGNAYRHNDPVWDKHVTLFMEDVLLEVACRIAPVINAASPTDSNSDSKASSDSSAERLAEVRRKLEAARARVEAGGAGSGGTENNTTTNANPSIALTTQFDAVKEGKRNDSVSSSLSLSFSKAQA